MKFWQDFKKAWRGEKPLEVDVELDERHLILVAGIVLFIVIYLLI
jgi:hypothetical protein